MNNPSAFPTVETGPDGRQSVEVGMSLRDYFAAQALSVAYAAYWECRRELPEVPKNWAKALAKEAYALADAMLAERQRKGET